VVLVLLLGASWVRSHHPGLAGIPERFRKFTSDRRRVGRQVSKEEIALRQLNEQLNEASNRYAQQSQGAESLAAAEEAVNTAKKLLSFDPDNPIYLSDLAISYQRLGTAKEVFTGPREALPDYLAYRDISERLNRERPTPSNLRSLAISHLKVGAVEWHCDGAEQAIPYFVSGNALMMKLYRLEPTSINRGFLAASYDELGRVRLDANQPEPALAEFRKAMELHSLEDAEHPSEQTKISLAWSQMAIGLAILDIDGGEKALPYFEGARDRLAPLVQDQRPMSRCMFPYAVSLSRIGSALNAMGKADDSVESFRAGLKLFEQLHRSSPGYSLASQIVDSHWQIALIELNQAKQAGEAARTPELLADSLQHVQAVRDLLTPYADSGALSPIERDRLAKSIEMIKVLTPRSR
jgi:tetratricopeptide (TPR) repeat protein